MPMVAVKQPYVLFVVMMIPTYLVLADNLNYDLLPAI